MINSKIFLLTFGLGLVLLVLLGIVGFFPTSFVGLFLGRTWTPDNPLNLARILGGLFLVIAVLTFSNKGTINLALLLSSIGLILLTYLLLNLTGDVSDRIHFTAHFILPLWGIIGAVIDKRILRTK